MADNQDPKISAQNAKNTQDTAKATANAADKQKLLRDVLEETLFLQRDYSSEVQKLGKGLGLGVLQTAELKKAFKDTANYAKDLTNAVDDVLDGTLDLEELNQKIAKGKQSEIAFNKELERSLTAMLADSGLLLENDTLITEVLADHNKLRDIANNFSQNLTEDQIKLLDLFALQSEELQRQKQYQDDLVNKATRQKELFGLTGDVLKSSTEAMKELGLGSLASAFNFDKASEAGKKMAAEIEATKEGALDTADRIKVLQASFSELGKGFVKNITSFEVIAAFALKSAIEASKQTAELQKETGMSYKNAYLLKQEMSGVAIASGDAFVTTEKLMKAAASLTHELGMSAEVLGHEALVSAANLEQKLGFSAKESATLVSNARLQGKNTEEVLDANIKIVGEFNKQNRTALNVSKVLKEAANASMSLQANLGFSNDKLIGAASAATKLGLSLSEVEGVADSLLNFEDSITKELEAELLTGKDLNFEKERQLALAGDLEGLSKSLNNNAAIQDAFASKNVLAQKALAESMGMTRDQLAKITLQQKFNTMAAEDFREMYGEATYESMKQEGAAEKLKNVLNKVLDILGSILGVFSPILDAIAYLASSSIGVATILAAVAYKTVPAMLSGFVGIGKSIAGMASGLTSMFKGGAGGIKDKIGGLLGGDKTKDIAGKAGDDISKTADKTKNVKGDAGKGIKQFLTGLGDGLASIGNQWGAVMKGSVALGVAGLVLGGSFALAMKMVENVEPAQMLAFASSLSMLGLTVALLGKIGSQVIQGAVALGILAVSLIPAAYAFSLLAGVDVDSIIAFSIALPLLSLAAAGLGFIAPFIIAGAAAFAVLGASLIPFAMALKLVQGVDATSFFDSLQKAITPQLALSTYAMAGALIALAAGFGTFAIAMGAAGIVSFFAGDGVLSQLETLASMANPLQTVANSLTQMAAGLLGVAEALNQIDEDKLESLNEFAEVSPLAAVGNAIGGAIEALFGGGEEKQTSPELAEIRDILNQILKKDTNIYMDSTKVGTGFAMGTSKVQ
jgi:hypothetical protein